MRSPCTAFTHTLRLLFLLLIACASVFLYVNTGRTAGGALIISEYRLRGPNGANDEFVEIYNNSDTNHGRAGRGGAGVL